MLYLCYGQKPWLMTPIRDPHGRTEKADSGWHQTTCSTDAVSVC